MIPELNLVEVGEGVPYEKIKYPDGQVSLKISMEMMGGHAAPDSMLIKSRMNSYEDVFYIISAADALRSWGVRTINLFVSCFLTQRSDREFIPGHSFDMWEMCDIIKQQEFHTITVFHPHSDVLPALLKTRTNRVTVLDSKPFVLAATALIEQGQGKVTLVSPDAGAYKWAFKLAEKLQRDVVSANKSRDLTSGVITTELHADMSGKICLIVDDYCDGGRTFIQLAEVLRAQGASKVYLYTSHGLYSGGLDRLKRVIDGVFTTNSIKDEQDYDFLNRFKVI